MLQGGMRTADVARAINCHVRTVRRLRQHYRETGRTADHPRSGRPRVTTPAQDRYIRISHLRDRGIYMGHLLSKNGNRVKKRKRKLRKNCFLHGPCMLCFIVHNTSSIDEDCLESASKLAERYATLSSPEDCAKFLLSPKELAIWEEQGKSLLSSVPAKLIGPQLFRTVSSEYSEMVCKRKCTGVQKCTPCKQPRCTFQEVTEGNISGDPEPQCRIHLCPLPSSSSECSSIGLQVDLGEGPESAQCQSSSLISEIVSQENRRELKVCETDPPNINQLPSSILLKIFSHLSVKERCLSASLVCKYWCDLCLDFQFWKQIDLSGRQQVNDDLLIKIASRRQNVTEINISDCRNILDNGLCTLASQCPRLLKYTGYRCKQLSDLSLNAISVHCPHLQKVHVGNQDKLTDEALKQVTFSNCFNVIPIN
ncbi:FXL17 protein, partial [Polypterus senegalus]